MPGVERGGGLERCSWEKKSGGGGEILLKASLLRSRLEERRKSFQPTPLSPLHFMAKKRKGRRHELSQKKFRRGVLLLLFFVFFARALFGKKKDFFRLKKRGFSGKASWA